jgi:hypothetical protein
MSDTPPSAENLDDDPNEQLPAYATRLQHQITLAASKIADLNAAVIAKGYEVQRQRKRKKRVRAQVKHLETKLRDAKRSGKRSDISPAYIAEKKRELERQGQLIRTSQSEKQGLVAKVKAERERAKKLIVQRREEREQEVAASAE